MRDPSDSQERYFIVKGVTDTRPSCQGKIVAGAGSAFLVDALSDTGDYLNTHLEPIEIESRFYPGSGVPIHGRALEDWRFYPDQESWLQAVKQDRQRGQQYRREQDARHERWHAFLRKFLGGPLVRLIYWDVYHKRQT